MGVRQHGHRLNCRFLQVFNRLDRNSNRAHALDIEEFSTFALVSTPQMST